MDGKQIKRNDIAQAAKELFTDFGYKSVSMEQIAQRANVAKGTLYLYFKDKEALFGYLVEDLLREMESFVLSVEERHLTLLRELHTLIYNLLMFRRDQKFLYRISREAKELKTPAACNMVQTIDDKISGYIEHRLDEAVRQGVVRSCNTAVLSFVIIKVYAALAFEWEERHEPLDERMIAESVSMILSDGLIQTI